jgi:GT2 family glycosyltransferase
LTSDHAVIGYCRGQLVHGAFSESLLAVAMEGKTPLDAVIALEWGPNISTARNKIAADFLTRPAPWLLMCDTDMVFGGDTLDRLIAAADPVERPIVGGLCYSPFAGGGPYPTMYELVEKGPRRIGFVRPETVPEDQLVRVSATGTGFLLIHRSVLEKVRDTSGDEAAPWFREMPVGEPMALMGEDMTFCLRAGAAGFPVHVHTGIKIGHMKTTMLGGPQDAPAVARHAPRGGRPADLHVADRE